MPAIITLTTDWGSVDHYTGSVKAAIISRLPDARIVDITHSIPPFDLKRAAFILRNTWHQFPKHTIHIIGVNTEESETVPHVVAEYQNHYFIGADNGIFSLLFSKPPDQIYELLVPQDSNYFIFSTRDRFVKTAVHLALGNDIAELGTPRQQVTTFLSIQPVLNGNRLQARVTYIDNYQNVFLNVTADEFKQMGQGRRFSLFTKGKPNAVNKVHDAYGEVAEGEIVVLFSTTGYVEVAVNKGAAASLLGFRTDDIVVIEFEG